MILFLRDKRFQHPTQKPDANLLKIIYTYSFRQRQKERQLTISYF